jgi:putative acetyltransferase
VVILIGGTSGSGKTKLANTLMKSLGIPYISVDHLMMGIYRSNNDCGFTPMSPVSVINQHLWPIVREMIKTNIENNHSIIFEGFQILPKNIADFSSEYRSEVLSFFLALSPEYVKAHYDDIGKHRSAIESRSDIDDPDTITRKNIELINDCIGISVNCRILRRHYEEEMRHIVQEISSAFDVNSPQQVTSPKSAQSCSTT